MWHVMWSCYIPTQARRSVFSHVYHHIRAHHLFFDRLHKAHKAILWVHPLTHHAHTHTHTHTQGSVPIWYILSNFNQFSTHTTHTTPIPPTHTPPTDSLSFPHSYQIRIQCTLVREGEQSLLRSYDVVTALLTLLRDMYVTTTPTHTSTHTRPHTQVI